MLRQHKNITIGIFAAGFLLLSTSCENFLDLQPSDSLSSEGVINSKQTASAAIIGAYSKVQSYYSGYYITMGIMPADNLVYNGTLSEYLQLDQNSVSPDNRATVSAYKTIYEAINTANAIIEELPGLEDQTFSETDRNQILGEAYFIRALSYFDLGRAWGGIQIQLKPTSDLSVISGIKRSSLSDTYSQVLSDLNQAEELLPEDDANTRNRVQKNAAKALKARLYLYTEDWENAEKYATDVINSSKYSLVKPYSTFFTDPFLTEESIFEISFSSNNQNTYWKRWYPSSAGGDYTLKPSDELVDKLNDPDKGGSRSALIAGEGNNVYGVLYNTVSTSTDPVYVIRLAEMYLTRAEARAKKTAADISGAIDDLNTIRSRADVPDYSGKKSQEAVILAIEEERSIELAFEGHRWFDLVRTKRAGEVLGVTDTNYWVFPFPSSDILSDSDAEQNPGY